MVDEHICDCECHTKPEVIKHSKGKSCPCALCPICKQLIKLRMAKEHMEICVE